MLINWESSLSAGVLHSDTFRTEVQVPLPTDVASARKAFFWIVQVGVENFLCEGERSIKHLPYST